jgi:hypothetical protein
MVPSINHMPIYSYSESWLYQLIYHLIPIKKRGRHGRDRMVVGVATTLYIRNQNISAGLELTALVVIGTDCTWSISA